MTLEWPAYIVFTAGAALCTAGACGMIWGQGKYILHLLAGFALVALAFVMGILGWP